MKSKLEEKINLKTKPPGSLGKLEQIALQVGLIQNSLTPEITNPTLLVFAGDHGLSEEGVSPFPKEVTFQMVMNFLNGGAAINVFCRQNNIQLKVVDAGVDYDFNEIAGLEHQKIEYGTKNILKAPAMSIEECTNAMETGKKLVLIEKEKGCNCIGFGEMGIGNTSSASLLMHKFSGIALSDCTGKGTGHDNEGLKRKLQILEKAAAKYSVSQPKEILATYGGFEIAMMCGAMLEAKELNMIILMDGFIATSSLLAATKMNTKILDNCIFCHQSDEKGHKLMLDYLKVVPLLDLGMRLGEGTGAAVAFPIVKAAISFLNEMASFEEAGISNK